MEAGTVPRKLKRKSVGPIQLKGDRVNVLSYKPVSLTSMVY